MGEDSVEIDVSVDPRIVVAVLAFVLLLIRRRRGAGLSLLMALVLVFLGSSPLVSDVYHRHERQYPRHR